MYFERCTMPISDEVIELEPVKKSKSKFIVLIAIAAVMFALAATFLVLFLVKPGGSGDGVSGKVNEVTVNSSALFTSGSDSKLYASMGTEYTIYANASVDGDRSDDITWEFTPYNAFADENLVTGKDENGPYCRFKPNSAIADGNTAVTITAKSSSDPSVYRQIQFYVVKQGTEHIKFLRYTRGANSSASNATTIAGDEITVPHYFKNQNNSEKFYVAIEQLGAYNSDTEEYSPLTLADGYCAFSVESSNPSVIEVPASDVVQMTADQAPRFALRVLKMSDEPVTITVMANSAVARLTVNVKSSAELGYIESIYVVDQPIGTGDEAKAFFDKLVAAGDSANWHTLDKIGVKWLSDTTKNSVLTLPYMANYNNILSHVVLSPLSLQYDATKKEILNDWRSMISVTVDSDSKIKDAVNISKMNNTVNIICNSLANNLDCMLSFTDSTRNSIASSSATVKLNIVARNSEGEASVKLGNDTYDSKIIEELISKDQGVPISTGNQATLTVTYRFRAPASTHPELMLSSGYVSTGFKIRVDYLGSETGNNPGLTVKVGRTDIDDPDKIYNFSTSLSITHVDGSQNFTGNAPIQISVSPGAFQGKYNLTFEKIGTSIIGASFNDDNQNWTVEVPFDVTPLATSAEFITAKEGKELLSSNKVGMFAPPENYGVNNGIKTGIAELYVQNRSSTEPVQWKVTDFIRVNGSASYDIQSSSNIAQETSRLLNQSLTSDYRLRFTGRSLPIKADDRELRIDIKVRPQGDSETTLADFVIYVHVVDSVSSLSCSSGVETKKYGGNEDSFETFQKDNVSPFYVYSRQQSSYSTNNFELGFASNINDDNSFEAFEETPVGKKIEYRLKNGDGAVLFEFDGSSFVQKADLFEKSVKARRNISHIKVRYYLNDTDRVGSFCVGEPENIFAEKKYIFSRNADEIGVYTDPDYTDKLSLASFEYSKTINAGVREHFYVSAIINLSDDTLSGGKIIVNSDPAHMAIEHEDVYVTVHSEFTDIDGTPKSATDSEYYDFEAKTPDIALGDKKPYTMNIHGCGNKYTLTVTVQNMAQPLSTLSICVGGSDTPLDKLDFVNKNGTIDNYWYKKTIRVNAVYGAGTGTYNYYEPFTLSVPDCFDVYNNGIKLSSLNIQPVGEPDGKATTKTFDYELRLKATATAISDGEIFARGTASAAKESNKVSVTVGVGLDNIKFKIDENVYSTKDGQIASVGIKFANNSASSSEIVRIPLEFITLGGEEYTNIAYDFSKLTVPNGSGISVEVSEGKRTLLIALPANTPNTGNDKKSVSATFTDAAFGANKTFTVKLEIAVTHDVFSVSQPSNGYAVTTTGGSENQTVTFSPIFNNGESDYEPESIGEYSTSLVLMSNDAHSYTSYSGAVTINGTTITVPNTVYSSNIDGKQLCVCVKYGNLYSYAPINITTTAVGVRYKSGIAVSDSAASVKITASANSFTLVAVAYNLGNGEADLTKTITYKLYSDSAYKNEITTGITIGNDGVITFTEPPAYSGKIYYRASYDDAHYDVAIDYTVDIASVELFGISSDVLNGNNITMYYVDSTHNTTLDLFDHIKVNSVLSGMGYASGATLSVESSVSTIVSVSGNALYSVNSGTSIVTISATYNGTTVTHDYNVTVVGLSIVLDKESGTIDITVNDGSVEFTPTVSDKTLSFNLTPKYDTDKFSMVKDSETEKRTVKLIKSKFGAADYDKTHEIVGMYTFALPEGSSLNSANGLIIEKPFTLTVTNSFEFAGFELKDGNTPIAVNGKVPAVADKTYTIQIPNYVKDDYHSYSVRTGNSEIATATLDETGLITVTPVRTAFGNTYITVAITAYGKTIKRTQNYNFVDEVTVTTSMKDSSNNGVTNSSTVQIDYTTAAPTFTYALTVGNATVTVDNVHFTWSGDVEPSVDETNKSVTFTVSKPTTLTVIGYVEVDGRRYYGDEYKLTLDATAPVFTLDATKTEIQPDETATFSVSLPADTQFQGGYSVVYKFVAANGEGVDAITDVATIANNTTAKTATVTPDLQRTDDRAVVVRATITVSNGAYAGQKYVLEKSLTIKGVPLPTISVIETSYRRDLDKGITLADCINISTPNGVTVSDPKFSIPNDINYTFNGGVFTVSSAPADNRRDLSVGGKIEIGVSYTVTSEVNNGRQIPDSNNPMEIVIYINPTVTASGKTITEGRKGSYDIKNAVSIATGEAADSFKSTDDYIVDYMLSGYNAGVSVDGSTLTLDDNVTGGTKTVTLSANVTITSGVHAGAEISVGSVTVTVQPVPQHTVTFDSKGGSSVGDAKVLNGDRLNKPDDPTLTGHTFGGWYKDEGCTQAYDFNSNDNSVTSSFPLYAKWTPNRYTVTFDSNGGTTVANASIDYGEKVSRPSDPNKTGYTFDNWYTDVACTQEYHFDTELVTSSFTLYAKWNANNCTVTFKYDNGTADTVETVKYDDKVVKPNDPIKTGYSFGGWNVQDGGAYDFGSAVTSDITLVAQWTKNQYTVTFNTDGADTITAYTDVEHGSTIDAPTITPTKTGHDFGGWYLNGTLFVFNGTEGQTATPVTSDITLVAKWTIKTFTVTFYDDNGTTKLGEQTVEYDHSAVEPKDPTKTGHVFDGWYEKNGDNVSSTKYNFSNRLTSGNITLVAKWKETYEVTFKLDSADSDADAYATQTVISGEKVVEPKAPTKAGHTFVEWQLNGVAYNFETATVTGAITLVADWTINTYTVLFYDEDGATLLGAQTVTYNNVLQSDDVPAKDGHSVAWFTDKQLTQAFALNTPITANTTLYAKWTINTYTVTFDANGGSWTDTTETFKKVTDIEYNTKIPTDQIPDELENSGYTFGGWYKDAECTDDQKFDFENDTVQSGLTLYAKWTTI